MYNSICFNTTFGEGCVNVPKSTTAIILISLGIGMTIAGLAMLPAKKS